MTRRQALLAGAGGVAVIAAAQRLARRPSERGATLRLNARSRVEREGVLESLEKPVLWKAAESAVVICDMWDDHYCKNSVSRLEAMIPEMNRVVRSARELGVAIVHAPSGTMDFYAGTPQRERKRAWRRQHPDLAMADEDGISDDGQEIFNYFAQHGIANVVLMGVHTNLCVLGRPFGIRQQVRLGNNVVLARDLTDSMYDPRDPPYVSHERGTELVIEHIERYWCPSIIGNDLTTAADLT